ncbi:MAG: hypothetical protein LDL22_08245, partial [Hyphomicrobiales bacterium]|nr:hypothetical protein [Hyphomicrobiales bacterium]
MHAKAARGAPARSVPLPLIPLPPSPLPLVRHAAILAVLALLLAGLAGRPAAAQAVLALVNSRPVTSFDVEQRIRIAQIVDRRRLDRKSALTELVDDQVKLIEARRIGYRVT